LLEHNSAGFKMMRYPDHYIFTIDDFREIKIRFSEIEESNKLIITTEKDAVRLLKFKDELSDLPIYVLPVKHHFLFEEGKKFNEQVISFIRNFKHQN
jgi:tetraacyldisaccharide 4'-kinase